MVLSVKAGNELRDYLLNLLGKEATIIDGNGDCLSAPNLELVGRNFDIPESIKNSTSAIESNKDGKTQLFMPLEYEHEKVGYLIFNEKKETIDSFLPLIKSFAELLIQQYYQNNQPSLDSTDQFIIKLLNNSSPADYPKYESDSKVLGYDLSEKRIGIAIHLDGFWEECLLSIDQSSFERDQVIKNTKKKIETVISQFFSKNNDVIIAYLGSDKFIVYKAVNSLNEETVKNFLKKSYKSIFEPLKNYRIHNIGVGFGNSYSGVSGLVSGFKEADLALELGNKLWENGRSHYFGDLGILSILGEGNRQENLQFAERLLGNMRNEDLNKTLECFFDHNLNLTETADEMKVHRNTVIYRLNQISKILNADPRIFEQAMTIKIALLIKRLFY